MARQRKLSPERKAFINSLLEHYQPTDANDVQEMLKDLLGDTLQGMLEAEMDQKLGYSKYDYQNKASDINRTFYNPAFITDMVMDGVHENDSIDFLQRPFLPFFYDGQDFIRDPADGTVGNLDVIEFPHMAFDIIRGHSFGIHGDDRFFHVLSDRILILFDDLWFKLSFPVSWDINLHIAVAGMHGLLGMAISGIICFLVPIIILGISQFLIHFLIQGTFQDDGHHIPHNGIDIRSILDRYIVLFQVVAHHFPKSCFLWGILFSCHKINLQTGKSILHQFGGLHKLWDTPQAAG